MRNIAIYLLLFTYLSSGCEQQEQKSINTKIVDLTYSFSDETIYWVTAKEFELDTVFAGYTDKGYYYAANDFSAAEHGGTHIDAPIHFSDKGQYVDEIPLENLIGDAIKIDVSKNALDKPDYLVSIKDFTDWEDQNGKSIPDGAIVLLQTGHAAFYPDKGTYLGTCERGQDAVSLLHFPGLSPEAAQWIVDNRNIHAIGIDTPSIDYGQSQLFKSHVIPIVFQNELYSLPIAIGIEIYPAAAGVNADTWDPMDKVLLKTQEKLSLFLNCIRY